MFFRSLEGKNVESTAEDRGLACEVSGGSIKTLSGPLGIVDSNGLWFWLAGAEELTRDQNYQKQNFALLGYVMLVS